MKRFLFLMLFLFSITFTFASLNLDDNNLAIDNNGNVGIGNLTPETYLNIGKDNNDKHALITFETGATSGGGYRKWQIGVPSGTVAGAFDDFNFVIRDTGDTKLLVQLASGNVGIGTNSPLSKIDVNGSITNRGSLIFNSGTTQEWHVSLDGTSLNFTETGVGDNRLYLKAGGNVGIGTNNPQALLHVNGTAGNGTGVWANLSDRRLKKNIKNLKNSLDSVLNLQGVSFSWKDKDEDKKYGLQRGFIAQDVEKVYPEWVRKNKDGFYMLEKVGVEAVLVEAIKELNEKVEKLERKIKFLEEKNENR